MAKQRPTTPVDKSKGTVYGKPLSGADRRLSPLSTDNESRQREVSMYPED